MEQLVGHIEVSAPFGLPTVDENATQSRDARGSPRNAAGGVNIEHENPQAILHDRPQSFRRASPEVKAICYRFAGGHRIFERGRSSQVQRMPKPARPLTLLPGQLPIHRDPSTRAAFKLVDNRR